MPPVLKVARENKLVESLMLLAIAVVLAVTLQAFAVKPYKIPSGSMEPTLHVDDRVLVNRFAHRVLGHDPKVGDIVVFHPPRARTRRTRSAAPTARARARARRAPSRRRRSPSSRSSSASWPSAATRSRSAAAPSIRNGKQASEPFAAACDPASGACDFPNTIMSPRAPCSSWATTAATPTTAGSGARCRTTGSSAAPSPRTGRRPASAGRAERGLRRDVAWACHGHGTFAAPVVGALRRG